MRVRINSKTLAVASLFVLGQCAEAAIDFRTIALSGQQAPGAPSGQTLDISALTGAVATVNSSGDIAFASYLQRPGLPAASWGIWKNVGGTGLHLVVESGMQEPGKPAGVNFAPQVGGEPLGWWNFNAAGQIVFSRPGGIWSDRSSSLQLLVGSGDAAPGTAAGVMFNTFSFVPENNAGRIAFLSNLTGVGVTTGVGGNNVSDWVEKPDGTLSLIARQNDAPLGGKTITALLQPEWLNDAGTTVFRATRVGDGGLSLWQSTNGGTPTPIVMHGQQAPGLAAGVLFDFSSSSGHLGESWLNNAGHILFIGKINGGGINEEDSLWTDREGGGLKLVVRSGVAAPDIPGATIAYLSPIRFNEASRYAVRMQLDDGAGVDSTNDNALWVETGLNSLHLVARLGSQAPDLPAGVHFANIVPSFSTYNWIDGPISFNDNSEVAFFGHIGGVGVTADNNAGIWAMDSQKILHLIARTGSAITVGNGDVRQITALTLQDFNSLGQLAFSATFADGSSGIFLANVNAVPEPGALSLFVLSVVSGSICRRRFCR